MCVPLGDIATTGTMAHHLSEANTPASTSTSSATAIARPGCNKKCGNIDVPYPFGILDDSHPNSTCAINDFFLVTCNYSSTRPLLTVVGSNLPLTSISVEEGTIISSVPMAYVCTDSLSGYNMLLDWTPFHYYTLSHTRNKFTVVGCNTLGFIYNSDAGGDGGGCISTCAQAPDLHNQMSCSGDGFGCCQTDTQKRIRKYAIELLPVQSSTSESSGSTVRPYSHPCTYAFLADTRTLNVSDVLQHLPHDDPTLSQDPTSSVVFEWVVESKLCLEAQANSSSYACKDNADCVYSENGQGYRCLCKPGFTGNPYLEACRDIDECRDPVTYPCKGICKNTKGSYKCKCPIGTHGDGKIACQRISISNLATIIGVIIFAIAIGLLAFIILKKRRKEKNFLCNGGLVLKNQRVRIFNEAEILKATSNNHSDHFLGEGGFSSVYKGVLEDNTQVAMKIPKETKRTHLDHQEFQLEIAIISQVNHKNVVKLFGLCLETKIPLLIYEYVSNGTLYQHIHGERSQILTSWKNRLRVAAETAFAVDYLHSLADPPIIHGDVKTTNILLDENYTVKISDFGASVLISPGRSDMATKIQGTWGYLDPEYLMTGELTTASDVYSFGIVLLELLMGMKPNFTLQTGEKGNIIKYFITALQANDLARVVCFDVQNEEEMHQVKVFAEIAKKCINRSGIKRPTMKQVAEELARLARVHESLWAMEDKETERLLGENVDFSYDIEHDKINNSVDTVNMSSFYIES